MFFAHGFDDYLFDFGSRTGTGGLNMNTKQRMGGTCGHTSLVESASCASGPLGWRKPQAGQVQPERI